MSEMNHEPIDIPTFDRKSCSNPFSSTDDLSQFITLSNHLGVGLLHDCCNTAHRGGRLTRLQHNYDTFLSAFLISTTTKAIY